MLFGRSQWAERGYSLDKMTLRELVVAYVSYPGIQVYAMLSVMGIGYAAYQMSLGALGLLDLVTAMAVTVIAYPVVWYLLHRFFLHGRFLYRLPQTAALWKRIHFDHHRDPHDLGVLFGALSTTLPTILIVTLPIGWAIGGLTGAVVAATTGIVTTCVYEFCHCIQHLPFTPKSAFLRRIKKHHLAHHFYSEQGNFGITNFFWDRVFGTFYANPQDVPRSETVFNLGYTGQETVRFPWVAKLSGIEPDGSAVQRRPRPR